jgi:hypothetical protein
MKTRLGWFVILLLLCSAMVHAGSRERDVHNVVLVTLDGVRTQEMFGGADIEVLRSRLGEDGRLRRRMPTRPFAWCRSRTSTG